MLASMILHVRREEHSTSSDQCGLQKLHCTSTVTTRAHCYGRPAGDTPYIEFGYFF